MNSSTRTALTALVAFAAPAGAAVAWSTWGDQVPDPLPTHWNLRGEVDDTLALAVLGTVTVAAALLLASGAVLASVRSARQGSDRMIVTSLVWAAWLAAMTLVMPMWLARGETDASSAQMDVVAFLAVPFVPTLAALAAWALQPATAPPSPATAPGSPLRLGERERVAWVGRASSGWMLLVAAGLLVAAVLLVFTAWPLANLLALVAVVLFWAHVVTVRVDHRAMTISWGPTRWPRMTVPVAEVAGARVEHVEPLRWGGWGLRRTLRGTAVVSRRGPGIVVERRSGRLLAVTVDQPEVAVDLLNALVARDARTGG